MTINNPYNQQQQMSPYQPQGPMMPPPMPVQQPTGRRQRWNRRLMSGVAAKITSLPNWFAAYAVGAYVVALLGVSMIYSNYAMEWYFWLFGITWVAGFFYLSLKFTREWHIKRIRQTNSFEKRLFRTGLLLRILYVVFIYYFYINMTGVPHEFGSADSTSYIETATDFSMYLDYGILWSTLVEYAKTSLGDMGYPLSIMFIVRWFGEGSGIFVILLMNALLGAYTCVLVYRLTQRSINENTARIAAIFCMLHPVMICYCGMTLKEVLMTFLLFLFIFLADRMMRGKQYNFLSIAPMVMVGLLLFMFRTVLGMIAFMALFFALVMSDSKVVGWGKKIILGFIITVILFMSVSDNILNGVRQVMEADVRQQQEFSLEHRYGEKKKGGGNALAKYASTAVFAPLIFTIPFPSMVNVERQQDMQLIHGGNWMRNILSGFVIMAMFMLLLSGDWRKYTLPLAMLLGYLLMLAFTQFAHSLRFHIPVMPFEMMFAAYAITNMRKKHRNWYLIWCILCIVMCFGWNWFKLAGRGLI